MDSNQINPQSTKQPYANFGNDEIDLKELFWILWAKRWLIIGVTATSAVISVVVSLMMTEIYRAEATLAPAETEQSGGGLATQFGGAAAILGVNIGNSSANNINTTIAILQSRQFIGRFIDKNNLMVPLFAAGWDKRKQQRFIDEGIYDVETGAWVRENQVPTAHEAYRKFTSILSVSGPDRITDIVTVSITWHNPVEAAEWLNLLIIDLNQEIRSRDVLEANDAIEYLRNQLETTQLVDMQRVFYQLIESQTRITMLADVRDEYVFRVIDPAVVPDRKHAPRRSIIVSIGILIGFSLGILFVFGKRVWVAHARS